MIPHLTSALVGAIPYLLFLAVGVWLCVLSKPRNPVARTLAGTALVLALFAWFVSWLVGASVTVGPFYGFYAFVHSLFDAVPIGLLFFAAYKSSRPLEGAEEASRLEPRLKQLAAWLRRWWPGVVVAVGLMGLLVLIARYENRHLGLIGEDRYSSLIGAAPWLLFLAAGIWFCVQQNRRNPAAYTLMGTALLLALVAWFVRPWIASWSYSGLALGDYDYGTQQILTALGTFGATLCSAVPLGLLLRVVLKSPAPFREARLTGEIEQPARRLEPRATHMAALIGWGLLGGGVALVLYVGAVVACAWLDLLPKLGDPSRGGSGGVELILAVPPVVALGILAGVIIAARRARRGNQQDTSQARGAAE